MRSTPTNRPRDTPDSSSADSLPPLPEAWVVGGPEKQKLKAEVTSEPPWYDRLWTQVRMLVAFVAGAAVSYVIVKLVPGL